MRTIRQSYFIAAAPSQVYEALTNADEIAAWSGSEAHMEAWPGGPFSLWDGSIYGTNLELEPDRRLVQTWREDTWNADVRSRVTFTLTPDGEGTRLDLLHEDVPDDEYDDIAEGWDIYYLGVIKEYLESEQG